MTSMRPAFFSTSSRWTSVVATVGGSTRTVVMCGTDDGTLRCASFLAEAITYEESYEGCEDEDVHPEARQHGHSLAYAFSQGTLRLARQPAAREDVPATMPRALRIRAKAPWPVIPRTGKRGNVASTERSSTP